MRESQVEKYLHQQVIKLGGTTRKWVSPGHASVEDRICFFPDGEIWFIEMKKEGEKPTGSQWREITTHLMLGANAGYLAGVKEVDAFLQMDRPNLRRRWMSSHVIENVRMDKLKKEQCAFFEGLVG